jgi:hypothetical protein
MLYCLTIVSGIFAEAVVRGRVAAADDASVAAAIRSSEMLFRTGALADLVMLSAYLAVTVLLFELLRASGRALALMAAAFSVIGIAVLAASGLAHLAAFPLPQDAGSAVPAGLAMDLHGLGYTISLWFFAIYCMLVAWLAARRADLPRAVCALMALGGAVRLLLVTASLIAPEIASDVPRLVRLVPLIGEASFAIWLTAFGLRAVPRTV